MNQNADSRYWDTTVTQLILDFREAILAMGPILDRQQLPWTDTDQTLYHDYDDLEEALFRVLVQSPIEHSFPQAPNDHTVLHKPRFRRDDWSDVSFLSIENSGHSPNERWLAFNGLATHSANRDVVIAERLDDTSQTIGAVELPLDGAEFAFQRRRPDGSLTAHDTLRVLL